jgi:hypothetical protein
MFNNLSETNWMTRQQKWQIERRQRGLCTKCGMPAAIHSRGKRAGQTSVFCIEHLAEQRERNRAKARLERWDETSNPTSSKAMI